MQVFRLVYKLIISYRKLMFVYLAVFLGMIIILSKVNAGPENTGFVAEKLDVGVVNHDDGEYVEGMMDYFSKEHNIKMMEDNNDAIVEDLYWRALDYVLIVPEGFSKQLKQGKLEELSLSNVKVPGYFDAEFFEAELTMYNEKLLMLLNTGYDLNEAMEYMDTLQEEKVNVELASFVNQNQNDVIKQVFHYAPYFFMTVGVIAIGMVLITLNKKEVRERTECGATNLRERVFGIILGIMIIGVFMMAAILGIAAIMSKGTVFTDVRTPYYLINVLAMIIFALGFGYFAGNVANGMEGMNGIVNVSSLLLCFLGGVFVPKEFFGESVERVSRFIPTYWYVLNNDNISSFVEGNEGLLQGVLINSSAIVLAGVVFFVITLVLQNAKRSKII